MQFLEHFKVVSLLSALLLLLLVLDVDSVLRLCGDELPSTLDDICHMGQFKGFNSKLKRTLDQEKNAFDVDMEGGNALENLQTAIEDRSMLRKMFGLTESGQRLVSTRRQRHLGIYDECCLKPCTYGELTNYCRL